MSVPLSYLGAISTGHSSFTPTPSVEASPDVSVNGIPTLRQGDAFSPHGSPSPSIPHGRAVASGSSSVYINGMQAARIGDPIDCGDFVAEGSANVFVGG